MKGGGKEIEVDTMNIPGFGAPVDTPAAAKHAVRPVTIFATGSAASFPVLAIWPDDAKPPRPPNRHYICKTGW
jgi:hypothetical protein